MGRVALLVGLAMAWLGCRETPAPVAQEGVAEAPAPEAPLPRDALRIAPERLTRIQLTQPGGEPVMLEKDSESRWRVVAPVAYAANASSVEAIVEVLAEIEIQRRVADRPGPDDRLGANGIRVRFWADGGAERSFRVGAARDDETLVQIIGEPTVYAVRGRCRRRFERTLTQLRDPVITQFDATEVERVVFTNQHGRLELVADAERTGRFVERTPAIRGFDSARASQNVAVIAALRAKGFLDAPEHRSATGLFEEDTARATLWLRGREAPLTVWAGTRTRDRKLYLRTSESEQVFLVSAHLASSLIPRAAHFERSDEMLRELAAQPDAHAPPDENEPSHAPGDGHAHGAPPPTDVPAEILSELRELARSQRR